MKTLALVLATTALTATAASAAGISSFDADGDRFATKAEIAAVYPGFTASDFRDLDANRDNRISASEITAPGAAAILNKHVAGVAVQSVADIDANGDGFASQSELAAAYPGFGATDFDDIDSNNDGRVSSVELYAPVAQEVVTRYESGSDILVSLNALDADNSGFASYGELVAQYRNLSNVDFDRVDTNNDNRVSFNELYDLDAIEVLGKNL